MFSVTGALLKKRNIRNREVLWCLVVSVLVVILRLIHDAMECISSGIAPYRWQYANHTRIL